MTTAWRLRCAIWLDFGRPAAMKASVGWVRLDVLGVASAEEAAKLLGEAAGKADAEEGKEGTH